MPTARQLAANRANAQKSTGPRTAEGKSTSSQNALKSGIYSKSLLIPGEDPAELDALHDELYTHFAPANPDERNLLDLMITNQWTLRRLHACHTQMWTRATETFGDPDDTATPLVAPFQPLRRPPRQTAAHDQHRRPILPPRPHRAHQSPSRAPTREARSPTL